MDCVQRGLDYYNVANQSSNSSKDITFIVEHATNKIISSKITRPNKENGSRSK